MEASELKTKPVQQVMPQAVADAPAAVPAAASAAAPVAGATKRVAPKEMGVDPVVGWLVCIEGKDKGRDFRLHTERNFLGRSANQDICIPGDDTISREKHAILSFDPKKNEFWIQPGESSGLLYLNGDAVYVPAKLKDRDVIEIGQTRLAFLAFVNESFQW